MNNIIEIILYVLHLHKLRSKFMGSIELSACEALQRYKKYNKTYLQENNQQTFFAYSLNTDLDIFNLFNDVEQQFL